MMRLAVFDRSLATDNLGDEVIYQSVEAVLLDLFPVAFIHRIASHEALSDRSHKVLRAADMTFVAGSNLLPPDGERWRFTRGDCMFIDKLVITGAGWQNDATQLSRENTPIMRRAFHRTALHAVRDQPAADNLAKLGLSVLNASCPTLWALDAAATARIPASRAPEAVVTVTAYRNRPAEDAAFLRRVTESYRKVWFYPPMQSFISHRERIGFGDLPRIRATTAEYTRFFAENDIDYIGSRLHGGIRALQTGKRSLILQADNRARDIAAHTGLPSVRLDDLAGIRAWIEAPAPTVLRLPETAIAAWKTQFR
jgi:hypothetical protein